ncbi:hypothetical protein, partial [Xanthomonas vasicola]
NNSQWVLLAALRRPKIRIKQGVSAFFCLIASYGGCLNPKFDDGKFGGKLPPPKVSYRQSAFDRYSHS